MINSENISSFVGAFMCRQLCSNKNFADERTPKLSLKRQWIIAKQAINPTYWFTNVTVKTRYEAPDDFWVEIKQTQ